VCILALLWGGGAEPAAAAQTGGFEAALQAVEVPVEVPGSVIGVEETGPVLVGILDVAFIALAAAAVWWLWRVDVIRPGSFVRRGVRRLEGFPAWLMGLGMLVVLLGQGVGAGLGHALATGLASSGDAELAQKAMVAAMGGLAGVLAGLVILAAYAANGRGEGLEPRVRRRDVGRGALALLVTLPIVHVVSVAAVVAATMWRGERPELLAHDTLRLMVGNPGSPWVWVMGFSAIVLAPIAEELVFRVFLQSALLKAFRSTWAAVLMASAIFAAVHMGAGVGADDAHALPALFVLGVAMGIAYERRRSLVVPVVMHMGFNLLYVGLALVLG
jgi:membrane protease YdiL (CAAX protease family)